MCMAPRADNSIVLSEAKKKSPTNKSDYIMGIKLFKLLVCA